MKIYVLNINSREAGRISGEPIKTNYSSAWTSKELAYTDFVQYMKIRYFTNADAVHSLLEMNKYKEAIDLLREDYYLAEALGSDCDYPYITYKVEIKELDLKGSVYE